MNGIIEVNSEKSSQTEVEKLLKPFEEFVSNNNINSPECYQKILGLIPPSVKKDTSVKESKSVRMAKSVIKALSEEHNLDLRMFKFFCLSIDNTKRVEKRGIIEKESKFKYDRKKSELAFKVGITTNKLSVKHTRDHYVKWKKRYDEIMNYCDELIEKNNAESKEQKSKPSSKASPTIHNESKEQKGELSSKTSPSTWRQFLKGFLEGLINAFCPPLCSCPCTFGTPEGEISSSNRPENSKYETTQNGNLSSAPAVSSRTSLHFRSNSNNNPVKTVLTRNRCL